MEVTHARIKTSLIDRIAWGRRHLCRKTSPWSASTKCGNRPAGQGLPQRARPQRSPEPGGSKHPNPKAIELANQKALRADIAKLYEMASDLKDQADKTDPASTLSVAVVKKAQEIEKLAKQIKNLARG